MGHPLPHIVSMALVAIRRRIRSCLGLDSQMNGPVLTLLPQLAGTRRANDELKDAGVLSQKI